MVNFDHHEGEQHNTTQRRAENWARAHLVDVDNAESAVLVRSPYLPKVVVEGLEILVDLLWASHQAQVKRTENANVP